jgi:hypothetical protein
MTSDETWVQFVNAHTKEQSKQWIHMHSTNKPKKFKQTLRNKNMTATLIWDRKGILLTQFMVLGTTLKSEVYCKTLYKLWRSILTKWHGMLSKGAILLHKNTKPHITARKNAFIKLFNWKIFEQPP